MTPPDSPDAERPAQGQQGAPGRGRPPAPPVPRPARAERADAQPGVEARSLEGAVHSDSQNGPWEPIAPASSELEAVPVAGPDERPARATASGKPKRAVKPAAGGRPDDANRCQARSRSGNQCGSWVVPGRRVCRLHGGLSTPTVKHGRYSEVLRSLRKAYRAALDDERLMNLDENLAVLDAVLQEELAEFEAGAAPQSWDDACALMDQLRDNLTKAESDKANATLQKLAKLLSLGAQRARARQAIKASITAKAKRTEAAWDVRLSAANAINMRDLIVVLGRFADLVTEEAGLQISHRVMTRIDQEVLGGVLNQPNPSAAPARAAIAAR